MEWKLCLVWAILSVVTIYQATVISTWKPYCPIVGLKVFLTSIYIFRVGSDLIIFFTIRNTREDFNWIHLGPEVEPLQKLLQYGQLE